MVFPVSLSRLPFCLLLDSLFFLPPVVVPHCSPRCPPGADQHLHARPPCRVRAVPRAWLASWAGGYCSCSGHCACSHVCCCHLKIICDFWTKPAFSFGTGPHQLFSQSCLRAQKLTESSEGRRRFQNSEEGRGERKMGPDKPGKVRRRWAGCSLDVAGNVPGTFT